MYLIYESDTWGRSVQIRYKQNGCITSALFYGVWADQKTLLAYVWHEEWFYTAGPVPWNGASDLPDGKPWISMLLSRNGFTILSPVTFLAFGLSTNVPLMLLISWLLTLMHEACSQSWLITRLWLCNDCLLDQDGA